MVRNLHALCTNLACLIGLIWITGQLHEQTAGHQLQEAQL